MQDEVALQQRSDPVPAPDGAIVTDSNEYIAISEMDDIDINHKYVNHFGIRSTRVI